MNAVLSIPDLATLRLTTGTAPGQQALLRAWYPGRTGGGGLFRWDASATAPDDGGTVIQPTGHAGNGRWLREQVQDVRDFGADPTGAHESTAAWEACHAWALAHGQEMVLPPGRYLLSGLTA